MLWMVFIGDRWAWVQSIAFDPSNEWFYIGLICKSIGKGTLRELIVFVLLNIWVFIWMWIFWLKCWLNGLNMFSTQILFIANDRSASS